MIIFKVKNYDLSFYRKRKESWFSKNHLFFERFDGKAFASYDAYVTKDKEKKSNFKKQAQI